MPRSSLPIPPTLRRSTGPAELNPPDAEPGPVGHRRRAVGVIAHVVTVLLMLSVPAAAYADAGDVVLAAPNDLPTVIANVQAWIMGILVAVASLFLVYAGALRATAGGDPAMVERSKEAFKNALIGYAAAVLAPVFLQILQGILGG